MKILLVSPASGAWKGISRRRLFNGKTFRFSMLSLLTVAGLTPDGDEVRIVDEQVEAVPLDEPFDLVGITVMTAAAPRAYEIAALFRARGVPVVLGGFHASMNTAEALGHADAVVAGEAYGAWEDLLGDLREGSMRRLYHGRPPDGKEPPLPRHLLESSGYVTMNATYATVGCTNRCHFCSITAFHAGRRRRRAIADVVTEIASFRKKFFMFVDDNLTQDREYTRDLLTALVPLKKRWVTQASLDAAEDEDLLRLLRKAGCIGLFVGLETLSAGTLRDQEKDCNAPGRYAEAVARIHRHGMFVEAGIMFGFDADGPEVFRRTLRMLDSSGIDAIQASILTPLPGTPLFEKMKGRIFDRNWEHYDYRHAVFTPRRMTATQLQAGADWVIRSFYSLRRIARRTLRWLRMPRAARLIPYAMALNMAYYGRVKAFSIRGYNPDRTKRPLHANRPARLLQGEKWSVPL